jgi:hypothetical protein
MHHCASRRSGAASEKNKAYSMKRLAGLLRCLFVIVEAEVA